MSRSTDPARSLMRALALATTVFIAACGGGGGSDTTAPPPPAPDAVFSTDNAWSGAAPAEAASASAETFRSAVASGQVRLGGPTAEAQQRAVREAQFNEDRSVLAAAASSPAAAAALARAAAASEPWADVAVNGVGLPQPVMLFGPASGLRSLADAQARSQQPENALAVYRRVYELLPEALRAALPTPDSLVGRSVDTVNAALADANARLAAQAAPLRNTRVTTALDERAHALALMPGAGSDRDNGNCSPTNLAGAYWFALKYFLNPAKDQGKRSTCWAFAASGALEIRERVQADRLLDLSEQFLVHKVRQQWFPNDTVESGSAASALNAALLVGQTLAPESFWTYNRALNRLSDKNFVGVCNPYGSGATAGTCSETAHESEQVCTQVDGHNYCAYQRVDYTGAGAAPGAVSSLWVSGKPFQLAIYKQLLSSGVPLLASMPVHSGFMNVSNNTNSANRAVRGVVTDTRATRYDDTLRREVAGSYGDHEVLIVGFLSNDELSSVGAPVDVPGGGYFVVRNSWGCGWGDGGYAYVPAEYVEQRFNALDLLEFNGNRSAAWVAEQANPGSNLSLVIAVPNPIGQADLRVPRDLAAFFTVSHPLARSVRVVITSDVEGTLYDGPWITDPDVLAGTSVPHAFTATGRHLLTVRAFYGSQTTEVGVAVDVINSAPVVRLLGSGVAHQGELYAITAQVTDVNETNAAALCSRTSWRVTAPDVLSAPTGCAQQLVFGATGPRTVEVTTLDQEGLATTAQVRVEVQPPAANPYPRITGAAVLSREMAGVLVQFCQDVGVSAGQLIDLREVGCIAEAGQPAPQRYSARVDVENPPAEVLGYEWNLYVNTNGVETNLLGGPLVTAVNSVTLASPGNQGTVINDCRLTVTVRAPQAERNKDRTVWSGRCAYGLPRPG